MDLGANGTTVTESALISLTGASFPVTVVSPQTTVTQPGRYCWRAVYSGNAATGIPGSSDSSAGECFTVNAVPSSLSSAQRWVPNDLVAVSAPAGGNLAGSVSFELFANGTCTGSSIYSTTRGGRRCIAADGEQQREIPASCHETSALTVTNGGTVSSP